MKIKSLLKHNLMRAAMTLALMMACVAAWAQTTVSYIDADGNTQTAQAVALDGNEPTVTEYGRQYINLAGGWYFVGTDITYSDVTIRTNSEDVNLILADGCTMHIGTSASPNTNEGIVRINNLTIYGQNLDPSVAGTLSYVGNSGGIWVGGSYTQHSGNVSISNNLPAGGRGIEAGSVTLLGGTLTIATESRYAKAIYADHDITISGGTLSATATGSSDNIYGIYSDDLNGTITLGWTRSADRITASSYSASTVKVADGQVLTDDSGRFYSGTLSAEDISAIGGLTLHPYSNNDFSVNEEGTECTIQTAKGWDVFCDLLAENTKGYFTGKTVALGDDIEVSRMAGNVNHDFTGTFDGNGHTLTFNHTAADNYCAPFRYVQGNSNTDHAVIQNLNVVTNITADDYRHPAGLIALQSGYVDVTDCNAVVNINCTKGTYNPNDLYPAGLVSQSNNTGSLTVSGCTVSGTISTDGKYAAGMVGIVQNSASVTNSVSSVTISSSTSGDGTHSGFVASLPSGRQLTIEGCVFNGKIVTTNGLTTKCGGFLGHNNTVGGTGATITNCLYAPTADPNTVSTGCATFGRNVSSDLISNCYYTTALGDAQGTQAYSISGGDYVTVGNAGTASSSYAVSGLDFYSVGLKCGNVLYAEGNDVLSLTLGCTAPSGYYCTGYTATAGTLNGTTLTMPYGNVTINATLEQVPPVNYVDQNGETQQCTNYIWLIGTETTLGAEGQETWCVVHSTLDYSQGIQLLGNTHIILCDGAAMNIGTIDNPVSGSSFQEKVGFYGSGNNLSLYAQSGNTGALTIYSQSCSFFVKDLTIAGGNVNATSLSDVPVIFCDNLTVRRSSLEVHANYYAAIQANNDVTLSNVTANLNSSNAVGLICSNFAVDNSQLTVNARYQAIEASNVITLSNVTANINSSNGNGLVCSNFAVDHSQLTVTALYQAIQASNVITLGCTAATDFIKATNTSSLTGSYSGTVKIADGQTLYDGANAYTGTLTDAQRQAIGGQKLTNVAPPTYDYIDLNGTGATHTAVVIDADNMPTALSGWYIVQGTVNYTNTINLGGDTHIILADNAVMNVTASEGNYGIQSTSGNNYSLFVYGQTGQSGELNVTSNSIACFISGGDITIAGGKVTASGRIIGLYAQYTNNNGGNVTIKNATVTATGTSYFGILSEYGGNITIDNSNVTATSTGSSGIYAGNGNITIDNSNVTATSTGSSGIYAENGNITIASGTVTASGSSTQFGIYTVYGSVTINGGQVMATGNLGIYTVNGSVTINGGQVSAIGNTYGIYAQNPSDNITLGWTNPTDYIYVNKYYAGGTLSIADGKTFIDENNTFYSGTIAQVDGAYPIDGKRLYPYIEGSVPYIDENGQRQLCTEYNVLNGTETTLGTSGQETWYVADGMLDYSQTINLNGNVHLILKDNAVMNVGTTESPISGHGINGNSHSISIYAQSMGNSKGQLHVNAYACGIFTIGGNVNINGGEVEATGSIENREEGIIVLKSGSNGGSISISNATVTASGSIGIHANSGITINSGTVTTNNCNYGIFASSCSLTINGGQVTANGSTYGIWSEGDLTLGWTNASDYIHANSYLAGGILSIAEGKAFIDEDGNNYNSGTVNADINGKTLYPYIEGSVPYIDKNGQRQLCTDYNVLTGTETTLGTSGQETWYVADGTLDYSHNITLNGDVHLILKDNAVMNVGTEETPVTNHGIYSEGHSISIYAQSMGESQGQLHVNAKLCGIFTRGGNVNICGGEVETAGDSEKYGEGIIAIAIPTYPNSGSITITNAAVTATGYTGIDAQGGGLIINSGRVIANSTVYGLLSYGNITINGGQVTAEGNTYGIFANGGGSITLGWTNPTDYIYASSYSAGGTLSIADGKTFIDEAGQTYSGTVAKVDDAYAIDGKWLYPNTVSRFTKTIAAHHTEEGVNYGWYLIASPLSSGTNAEAVAHLVNSETPAHFDLYRFNQAAELEWENWKQQNSDHYHFNLEPGRGYLYANAADVNLVFAGTPYSGNGEVTITNVAGHPLSGWNLVGNPFSVDAYIGRDFYVLNESRSEVMPEASTGAIPPMEGVFVLAEQDEETVTFSTEALNKGRASKPEQVVLNLSRDRGLVIDRAIVRMGEGRTLPKFQLNQNSTKLYIPQDGTDYAIACAESTGEMPLNFKASENGTYTLTISTTLNSQHSTLNYLHLIDNMTGADVDLLTPPACGHPLSEGEAQSGAELGSNSPATDSQTLAGVPPLQRGQGGFNYTFTAKTTDYESRFELVFSICEDANGDNEAFAFIDASGNIIVNGEGTLQVFDVLGHQLVTKQLSTLNSQLSTLNYKSGVYVLRLIDGDTIRTQKIVIE